MKRLAVLAASTLFGGCVASTTPGPANPPPPDGVQGSTPPGEPMNPDSQQATAPPGEPASGDDVAPEITNDEEEVVATSEPPDPVYEEQTDAPSPGMFWIGGYWHWTGNDWAWFPGAWHTPPAGRIYIEPYYEHVNGHVVYVHGFWGARGTEHGYYGGDRIVFNRPIRPAGYVRGHYTPVPRSGGLPPGKRGHYGPKPPATMKRRPMPTATAPKRAVSHEAGRGSSGQARPDEKKPEGKAADSKKSEGRAEEKPEGKTDAKKPEEKADEKKPEAKKPEAKPEPKPEPKKEPARGSKK